MCCIKSNNNKQTNEKRKKKKKSTQWYILFSSAQVYMWELGFEGTVCIPWIHCWDTKFCRHLSEWEKLM